ncbi:phosphodiester glycosidase family protein [Deinococcus sp.]|uniref:phosphodiester glycosidase family protein n=1 Tax=Deinococcus sp. TaxID=47478 RepID=UPI0025DB2C7D|nr:phosphodiester glycosidase family protein [Deinococcus sp.]
MRRALCVLSLTLSPSALAVQVSFPVWQGKSYTVNTLDLRRDTLKLYWNNPATKAPFLQFSDLSSYLAGRGETLQFATNSGIYTPAYAPLGLHIEAGRVLRPLVQSRRANTPGGGNFALKPNGVFWTKGSQAGVTETGAYARSPVSPDYATQSGPMLVIGGKIHPEFGASSASFKIRSGVGVCRGGPGQNQVVKFAISAAPVNFYSFATFFRDALGCPDALYLDGSISAVYTPELGGTQFVNFAGLWGVTTRH